MKKTLWMLSLLSVLFLTGCSLKDIVVWPTPTSWEVEIITGEVINTGDMFPVMDYSGDLIVAGVGPKISFEQTVAEDTLVLKNNFDDHTDHIFIDRQMRSNYLDIQEDALPGNTIKFAGTVKALDAAAGNRYYQVISINDLKKIGTPTQDEVIALVAKYGYCQTDADCIGIYGKCPLPCQIAINTNFSWVVENIINNFRNAQESQCTYKCMEIKKVICNNKYVCEITK